MFNANHVDGAKYARENDPNEGVEKRGE